MHTEIGPTFVGHAFALFALPDQCLKGLNRMHTEIAPPFVGQCFGQILSQQM